ncbi:MAG: hypothetical protein IJO55_05620 [Lachnospiraceae bacterium]|nr:hypothetical protein [Lachnospiraceae bacterium]
MKKNHLLALAAVLIVGAVSVTSYTRYVSPVAKEYSILTPDSEEIELEEGMLIIDDEDVPLADGPGGPGGPASNGPGGPGASPAPSEQPTAQITVDKNLQRLVDLVNQERAKAGLTPLTMVEETNTAAGIRAKEIYNKFAHERPDGSKYRTVLDQCNVSYSYCGENVAYGYRSPDAVMDGWMNSEGHKANILNERFTKIGVGHYKGSNGYDYWSQLFTN